MAQILVRGLDDAVVDRLKARAKANHRSLQGEVKAILEREAVPRMTAEEFHATTARWQERWRSENRRFTDSADLIREDRDSR